MMTFEYKVTYMDGVKEVHVGSPGDQLDSGFLEIIELLDGCRTIVNLRHVRHIMTKKIDLSVSKDGE